MGNTKDNGNGETASLLMDKQELARAFHVSVRTVERWMKHGCPYRKIGASGLGGKAVRFRLEEVDAWLYSQEGGER